MIIIIFDYKLNQVTFYNTLLVADAPAHQVHPPRSWRGLDTITVFATVLGVALLSGGSAAVLYPQGGGLGGGSRARHGHILSPY